MLFPPESWTNPVVRLYHGTLRSHAESLVTQGIQAGMGRTRTDFGPGFYTTTLERQAQSWAYEAAERISGDAAAVVMIEMDRDQLAELHTLAFVRGDFDAEDY
jgi:predicted sugar kinase